MRYNVAQLLKEPVGSSRSYHLEEDFTGPERCADTACGPVDMLRTHHGVLVRATMEIESTLTCGRCLSEFASASELLIEEEFFPTVDLQTGLSLAPPAGVEEASLIDSSHILDLTGTVMEYVVAGRSMKPLCRIDCRGLCQECGNNHNLNSCDCASQRRDPRWYALTGLARGLEV